MLLVFLFLFVVNGALSQATYRVFGGLEAEKNEFPYMVGIRNIDEDKFICGGSLITTKTVLSAAHCFNIVVTLDDGSSVYLRTRHPNEVYVWTDSVLLSSGGVKHKIDKIIRHPLWRFEHNLESTNNGKYDIALTITNDGFRLSETLSIIPLNYQFVRAGNVVDFSGWGRTEKTQRPDKLQRLKVVTITKKKCFDPYHNVPFSHQIFSKSSLSTAICTQCRAGYGLCYGDSGGPLVLNGRQIGIASRGSTKCADGKPFIFTRVSRFRNFITSYKVD